MNTAAYLSSNTAYSVHRYEHSSTHFQ